MTKRVRNLTVCALVILFCAACFLGIGWYREANSHEDLEQLCTSAAHAARDRFADFKSNGSEFSYDYAVSELVSFFNSYLLLCVEIEGSSNPNCTYLNSLIADLMADPAAGETVAGELVELMEMLAADIHDENAYMLAFFLHNQLAK